MKIIIAAALTLFAFIMLDQWIRPEHHSPLTIEPSCKDSIIRDTILIHDTTVIIRLIPARKLIKVKRPRPLQHFFPRGEILENCIPGVCDTVIFKTI